MKKIFLAIIFFCFHFATKSQNITLLVKAKKIEVVDSLKLGGVWRSTWLSGGGGSTDTTSLSNRINALNTIKLNIADSNFYKHWKLIGNDVYNKNSNSVFISKYQVLSPPSIPVGDTTWYFGTSIVAGMPLSDISKRWTTLLSKAINTTEVNAGVGSSTLSKRTPIDFFGGVNMVDRMSTIPNNRNTLRFLIFSYGINDIGANFPAYDTVAFKADYRTVLNNVFSKGWTTEKVILTSPEYLTPEGATQYTGFIIGSGGSTVDSNRAKLFYDATKKIAAEYNLKWIDIYTPMKNAYNNGGLTMWSDEGIHPNFIGHLYEKKYILDSIYPNKIYTKSQDFAVNGIAEINNLKINALTTEFNTHRLLVINDTGLVAMKPFDVLDDLKQASRLNYKNTSIGYDAFVSNTTGRYNSVYGYLAMKSNTIGQGGTAIGQNAMGLNTGGNENTGIGVNSLYANLIGNDNAAVGYEALSRATTNYNTAIGAYAGNGIVGGSQNTAIGLQTQYATSNGSNNTSIGVHSLLNSTGSNNQAFGWQAGADIYTGNYNVVIGTHRAARLSGFSNWMLFSDGAGNERFTVDNNGLFGIATTVPNSTLQINGSLSLNYREANSATNLTTSDLTLNCTSGTFTVTLPTAVGITGRIYIIKNTGTSTTITVQPQSGEKIDGANNQTITTLLPLRLISNGSNWIII